MPHQKPTCQNTRTNMPTTRDQHEMSKKACRQCWSVGPECIFLRIICGMLVPGMKKIIFQKSNRWQDQHSKNYLCRHVGPRSACWSCCVGMLVFCRRVGPVFLACWSSVGVLILVCCMLVLCRHVDPGVLACWFWCVGMLVSVYMQAGPEGWHVDSVWCINPGMLA